MKYKNMTQFQIMESHIAACKSCGDTVKEYCLKHKINRSNFYYWQKKSQPQPAGKFINITPSLTNVPVSIVFTNGNRICFDSMPPAAYLKQLLG